MEHEAIVALTSKVVFIEEPKWTTVMAKNVRQVVSRVVKTLADTPIKEQCKLNLRLMSFEAKEGETEKELVAAVQHRTVARPNEIVCQGCHRHTVMACDYAGLHIDGRRTPWCGATQIRNK